MRAHGTPHRYWSGCRCDDCRTAHTAYERDRSRGNIQWRRGINPPSVDSSYRAYVLARVEIDNIHDCWPWLGYMNRKGGYGFLKVKRDGKPATAYAHRAVYELIVGPIPDGLQIDHLCGIRSCCNPLHLEPVTQSENMRRAHARKASAA